MTKNERDEIDRSPTAAELRAHEAEEDANEWASCCDAMNRAEANWIDGYADAESAADLELFNSQFPDGYTERRVIDRLLRDVRDPADASEVWS